MDCTVHFCTYSPVLVQLVIQQAEWLLHFQTSFGCFFVFFKKNIQTLTQEWLQFAVNSSTLQQIYAQTNKYNYKCTDCTFKLTYSSNSNFQKLQQVPQELLLLLQRLLLQFQHFPLQKTSTHRVSCLLQKETSFIENKKFWKYLSFITQKAAINNYQLSLVQ